MALKTGTITARPTLLSNTNTGILVNASGFVAGNGDMYVSSSSSYGVAILHGFNFDELKEKKNVTIKKIKLAVTYKQYSGTSVSSSTDIKFRYIADWSTIAKYTDLGDGSITLTTKGSLDYTSVEATEEVTPEALDWINNNFTSFLNGLSQKTFGVRMYFKYAYISSLTITLTYEHEADEINQIYIGTAQPSKIYVGTQEVKAVYVGTTKVYG